jgi:hypothetical protein
MSHYRFGARVVSDADGATAQAMSAGQDLEEDGFFGSNSDDVGHNLLRIVSFQVTKP